MADAIGSHLFHQNTDLEIMELLLPYVQHRNFLDIGAEKGEFTRFFSQHQLQGIFFEPLPKCEKELAQLAEETHCTFSSYAIDANDRTADFYHAFDKSDNDAQHFSSLHPLQNDERINHKKVTTVQCRSLNSLLQEGFIPQPLGVIKVDTEGNDLNVLKGMTDVKTEVLMCEFHMPNIYAGWELGHPIGLIEQAKQLGFNHFLSIKRINGFEFISINNAHFLDKQWGNLIFVSDAVYQQAAARINDYVAKKEENVISSFLARVNGLQATCDERMTVINTLSNEIDRLRAVEQTYINNNLWRKLFKFFKLK